MVNKKTIRNIKIFSVITVILAFTASWAFYAFINELVGMFLTSLGVENELIRMSIIFLGIFALLVLLGLGVGKTFKKIIGE